MFSSLQVRVRAQKLPPWVWAPFLVAVVIMVAALAAHRAPDRVTPNIQVRTVAGIDKGSFLPTAQSRATDTTGASLEGEVAANQALFLREAAKKETGEWTSLGEPERAQQRAALKAAMLGDR